MSAIDELPERMRILPSVANLGHADRCQVLLSKLSGLAGKTSANRRGTLISLAAFCVAWADDLTKHEHQRRDSVWHGIHEAHGNHQPVAVWRHCRPVPIVGQVTLIDDLGFEVLHTGTKRRILWVEVYRFETRSQT